MTKDIGIIGAGFVGQSLLKLFGEDRCAVYDPRLGRKNKAAVNACKFAFVCVPTPTGRGGSVDTSIVEGAVGWCESEYIVIRSTIPPGTTNSLHRLTGKRIIFQPEYIGETVAHPLLDHQSQGFSVLGGPVPCASHLADLYATLYHAAHRFYFCPAIVAELAKYMENAFYAVKVTFCNEFHDIAQAFGVDYNELREVWLADPRISRDHTFVYPQDRGFSGKCLPKDTSGIIVASCDQRYRPVLLEAVMAINNVYRQGDKTYEQYGRLYGEPDPTSPTVFPAPPVARPPV